MSSNHHSNSIQELYEGDQSKLYSGVLSHHHGESIDSDASKKQVKSIWAVTGYLTIITIVEVGLGLMAHNWGVPKALLITIFLILTLVKARFIVARFMHLGDEIKSFFITMMIPLALFIWFIIAFLYDGNWWLHQNATYREAGYHIENTK